jgi:CelD/BcsL family acetyltransferase involved in cellulose biosynthesis
VEGEATVTQGLTILGIDDPRWEVFAAHHSEATAFHQPAWTRLLADCYRFQPRAAVSLDDSGSIIAGMPVLEIGGRSGRRRWVSLPFTDRCHPLTSNPEGQRGFARQLGEARRELGMRSIEIRDHLEGADWVDGQGHWHEIMLAADPDEVYERFDASRVKRKLRKAAREGLQVERGQTREDLVELFYGLHLDTRRRLGVPVQPRRFFELLWERMLAAGLGFLITARLDGNPVASAVFLSANGRVTYKFSAFDRRYGNLPGTHAVLWQAIQDSCEEGARVLDLGRTETGNEGLRTFKLGWGGNEQPLVYSLFAPAPPSGRLQAAHGLLKPVIRRSPTIVARAIGSVAYRYTA